VSIRWALEPLLRPARSKGWAGRPVIDILAIFGTVFGVATSLGLGVQQISTGMSEIGIVDEADNVLLVILIIVITFIAMMSVVSGVGAGMKWLSNINLSLAGLMLVCVLLLGPTLFLLQNLTQSVGTYLAEFFGMTFDVGAYQRGEGASTWFANWTIFYWGWWISWSPFVGIFIARISRGRTIRQFVAGVMIVPTLVGMLWFSVLGGSGIFRQLYGKKDLVEDGEVGVEHSLFAILGDLPWGTVFSVLGILLVAIFFITSSDSGSLVVDMLASGGHPNPPTWSRVVWSLVEGAVAIALLLAGGLSSLQSAALATALPFSIVLLLICVSTIKAFGMEAKRTAAIERAARFRQVGEHLADDFDEYLGEKVDERIDYRLTRSQSLLGKQRAKSGGRGEKRSGRDVPTRDTGSPDSEA
jgi:choline/glycine/proline betaine transport protein